MAESGEEWSTLSLEGWDRRRYEHGTYGPDGRDGVDAAFERETMSLAVRPVRYECTEGRETLRGLTTDMERTRDLVGMLPDVDVLTAFATIADYRPYSTDESAVLCVARDADDALAAAVWVAHDVTGDRDLQRNVGLHRGDRVGRSLAPVSDDDVLATLFADEPDRCVLSGRPTTSHHIRLPYRYFPVLSGTRRTPDGVPRFPSTVDSLVGAVSHTAWENEGLDEVAFDTPLERVDDSTWALDEAVLDAVADANAADFALDRLGSDST